MRSAGLLTPARSIAVKSLRGKVVLVNFWTYTCINSLRPMPYVKSWAAKYKGAGLVVIGVHTPEFSFEHERPNVEWATRTFNISFPVAIDSDENIWKAFHNEAWPAQYIVDGKGQIRYQHYGEGEYVAMERVIQKLLKENGASGFDEANSHRIRHRSGGRAEQQRRAVSGNLCRLPAQAEHFASTEKVARDSRRTYSAHAGAFAQPVGTRRFVGRGARGGGAAGSSRQGSVPVPQPRSKPDSGSNEGRQAGPIYRSHSTASRPAATTGVDAGADGNGEIREPRMYQLIRQKGFQIRDPTFEIEILETGAQVLDFTFG